MTRKPLPKAITRPLGDLRGFGARAATNEAAPAPQIIPPHDTAEAEPALAITSLPVANDPLPAGSIHARSLAAKRRKAARQIVDRYKFFAAGGGLFPVPIINVAGVTAIIMRMVKRLSDLYGVPFERDRTRSLVISLMGGTVPTGLAAATTSTLAFAVAPSMLVGLAVSSISAAALTRGIGLVFVEHFESGAMPASIADTARG